jgi:(2Fe-2S) ferredoxin
VTVCRDCCCGNLRKHPEVDHAALVDRLVQQTAGVAEVTVTTCLLACERSNVVVVSPSRTGRLVGARPVWLMQVVDVQTVDTIGRWLREGGPGLRDIPLALAAHRTTAGLRPGIPRLRAAPS